MAETANEFGQGEGVLTRAAGMVSDARIDFNNISRQLTDQIAGVQGRWGGQGATAFFALQQAWTEKQQVIVDALNEFENSLGVTERDNISTDDAQGANFTNLSNRMGN
ncbi:WXG100 family type VII secretion target [Nocardioides sp.]|uniref:WXG100 family type VII secretion target n=1 Tax=Nocardioides sp. TaxID=35761 RepID=UPI00286D3316|nr:WXG100 family type VII secretion target [Nocardioides sp.]